MAPPALPLTIQTAEADLDALLRDAKNTLGDKKGEVKTARGLVRQVARQRRALSRKKIIKRACRVAPKVAIYGLIVVGLIAFSIAMMLLISGNLPAALTLFTAAGAAWGLARALHR